MVNMEMVAKTIDVVVTIADLAHLLGAIVVAVVAHLPVAIAEVLHDAEAHQDAGIHAAVVREGAVLQDVEVAKVEVVEAEKRS